MAKNIFFDARYIRIDHHDGISRFSAGLAAALAQQWDLTVLISDLRQLEQLPIGIKFIKVSSPTSVFEPLLALKINRLGADVVFSPMQTMGTFGRKFKVVLTLHDLIYYRHPTPPPAFNFLIRALWRFYHLTYVPQRLLLNRADAIATVSETTKRLMLQNRLTKRPISVIYNAADEQPVEKAAAQPASKNLVYMGSFMDYKNVATLVQGMAQLPGFNLQLLSRISPKRKAELETLIAPGGGTVEFVGGVSDEEYHRLISEAFALVSASLDEGFGIPLVEAMSQAIPVVVSDIEIFREVAGGAGSFFDAKDPHAFATAVRELAERENWQTRASDSLTQAKLFSWEKSAHQLLALLKSL